MSNNILITGGAGFIGKKLTKALTENGENVRIIDSLSSQIHGHLPQDFDWIKENKNIEFIRGSITDYSLLQKVLTGIEVVVHLASETGTGQSMYEIDKYTNVNVQGTAKLMEVIINNKIKLKKFILASSRSVYGEGAYSCQKCNLSRHVPPSRPLSQLKKNIWDILCPLCNFPMMSLSTKESDILQPASIYAANKLSQENLVKISCTSSNIDYSILRLQNVYGEGQSLINPYTGILSIFSTKIRNGSFLPLFEDGKESRDFVHVDDVVNAILKCLKKREPINQVLNVGSGISYSIEEIANLLSYSFNSTPKTRVTAEYRIGDIRNNKADISKTNEIIGFKPAISIQEGLKRFAQWVNKQPLPLDKVEGANLELMNRGLLGNKDK